MSDFSTPNLPARSFDVTSGFYATLGFSESWRDEGWMILKRGNVMLEFFPHPDLDPQTSWFSCCLRLDNIEDFYAICRSTGIPETNVGWPRLHAPRTEDWGGKVGALIDPDGTLLRLIQN